jgi:hypothetical protein
VRLRRLIAKADKDLMSTRHERRRRGHSVSIKPMPITLKDKMKELSPAQRKKVEARAAELIAEEMTLRELRHARKLTQVRVVS